MNIRYDCGCELEDLGNSYHPVPRCDEARLLLKAWTSIPWGKPDAAAHRAYYAHFPQPTESRLGDKEEP